MNPSERLKYIFIWGLINATVCMLLILPWTFASLVALFRQRSLYDLVIHYPLVSTSISLLPQGSIGAVPNYILVEFVLLLVGGITTWIFIDQRETYKIEKKEHIREGVRRNYR